MSPPAAPHADGKSAKTGRDKLLYAALHLFQAHGYHAVGLSEILKAAELPKGSLYHHFPGGKPDLASAVIEHMSEIMARSFERALAAELPAAAHLNRLVRDSGHWLIRTEWREGAILAVMSVGISPDDSLIAPALTKARRRVVEAYGRYLHSEGIVNAHDLAQTVLSALDGAFIAARVQQDPAPLVAFENVFAPLLTPPGA